MPEINLTQAEADALLAMEKHAANAERYDFPMSGVSVMVPLNSPDKREQFLLDISRSRIELAKFKMQNRARQVVVLARLDLAGSPHRNPDNAEIPCPHLHIYKEGYGDKWAVPLPVAFSNTADHWQTLCDFMQFCNITQTPNIERGLFT